MLRKKEQAGAEAVGGDTRKVKVVVTGQRWGREWEELIGCPTRKPAAGTGSQDAVSRELNRSR